MKTRNQTRLKPTAAARRNIGTRTAVASLAIAAATIPSMAGNNVGSKEYSDAIRPFHINVPKEELTDLRRRINATRWPEKETVTDASQGVQLATMQKLARYWGTD